MLDFRPTLAAATIAALLMVSPSARAQNALGDGRALDHPLQQGVRVNPARPNFAAEVALRNAIVTGNIGGGRAFRGDVGYRAPGEFTGGDVTLSAGVLRELGVSAGSLGGAGSDDLFAFQRDAAGSAVGVRGLDALRYQMGLTTTVSARFRPGDLFITRPSGGASFPSAAGAALDAQALDPFSLRPGALRATTAHLADSFLEPSLLDSFDAGDALSYTLADPLRGVTRFTTPTPGDDDEADDAGSPLRLDGRVDARVSGRVESAPMSSRQSTLLEALRDRVIAPASATPPDAGDAPADPNAPDAPEVADDPLALTPDALDARLGRLRTALAGLGEPLDETDVPETLDLLRRETPVVSRYAPATNRQRDIYAEHMAAAQAYMTDGRWFDAEERFSGALLMRPDDPLAMAGRLHAELGAGLFLSASVNLRVLVTRHPEFLAARFDPALLPSVERLAQIEAMLRRNLDRTTSMASRSGLLLAYLGHQRGDAGAVQDGFAAIDRVREAQGDEPDPLIEILRRAWAPG